MLCDPGSLHLIRSEVISPAMGERARTGDGVIGGCGPGRRPTGVLLRPGPVLCRRFARRGARGHDRSRARAGRARRAPVVGFVSSGGARMQEGVAALGGYGRIFRRSVALSGRVPQISIVSGLSAGGGAYSPALTDWVVMTEDSSMFLTGPGVVREALGEDVDARAARRDAGPRAQRRLPLRRRDDLDVGSLARELLGYLPEPPRRVAARGGPSRPAGGCDPRRPCPGVSRAGSTTFATSSRASWTAASCWRSRRLGAQPGHRDGPDRRAAGGRDRQPAPLSRGRARRGQLREGRALRHQVQLVRDPAARPRRHPRVTCRAPARRPPG